MMLQEITAYRISQQSLIALLRKAFPEKGIDAFRIQYIGDHFIVNVPRRLTEDELDDLRFPYEELQEEAATANEIKWRAPQTDRSKKATLVDADAPSAEHLPKLLERKVGYVEVPIDFQGPGVATSAHLRVELQRAEGNLLLAGWFRQDSVIGKGETCAVYAVNSLLVTNNVRRLSRPDVTFGVPESESTKIAIKSLGRSTNVKHFLAEYEALRNVNERPHPNVVQLISAFRYEEAGQQVFNLAFPLALANLKQFLRGDIANLENDNRIETLWAQFEGLASAVQDLNMRCNLAHRDIKPSNILIYPDNTGTYFLAKLTDFGLAINLEGAMMYNVGTAEAKSAIRYDAPEIRRFAKSQLHQASAPKIPAKAELLAGDVWKLGAVFTELVTFLKLKSQGVLEFRRQITTKENHVESDDICDTRFDDGEKAKPEVKKWLQRIRRTHKGFCVADLCLNMLLAADARPSIELVVQRLRHPYELWHWDEQRLVRFTDHRTLDPPSDMSDKLKGYVQHKLGRSVDWRPFSQFQSRCSEDAARIHWMWGGQELYIDVSHEAAAAYKGSCKPLSELPASVPITPTHSYSQSGNQSSPSVGAGFSQQSSTGNLPSYPQSSSSGAGPSFQVAVVVGSPDPSQSVDKKLYWCVDKCWSEVRHTRRSTVDTAVLFNDTQLFLEFSRRYRDARGWLGKIFSWKNCQDVLFIEYCVVFTGADRVEKLSTGLPLAFSTQGRYDYLQKLPTEVHCKIAAKQLVLGMRKPSSYHGTQTLEMLPKHLIDASSPAVIATGARGHGMHAVQGWALYKILIWLALLTVTGLIFVVAWLVFVNPTDLQNAFIPAMFFTTMVAITLAIPQHLDKA